MKNTTKPALSVALMLLLAGSTYAASTSIGARFLGDGVGWVPTLLNPGDKAGFLVQSNWNNINTIGWDNAYSLSEAPCPPGGAISDALVDSAGNITVVRLIYDANDASFSDGAYGPTATPNDNLMSGCIKANAPASMYLNLTFTNLATALYDVYVYGAVDGGPADVYVSIGTETNFWTEPNAFTNYDGTPGDGTGFIDATSTNLSTPTPGDYVKFTGVTPVSGEIAVTATVANDGVGNEAGISALQIVSPTGFPTNTVPVAITRQPQPASVIAGWSATFTVQVSGPGPSFQWYSNNVAIPGATSALYTTPPATAGDNGAQYEVTVSNNINSVPSDEAALSVRTAVYEPGFAKAETWINGNATNQTVLESGSFVPNPFMTYLWAAVPAFEMRVDDSISQWDLDRVSGYVEPATSASYVFFECGSAPTDLFLSTDDNPANRRMIAQETQWSNPWEWLDAEGGAITNSTDPAIFMKRSDQWTNEVGATPYASGIPLNAGQKYYLEVDHFNNTGGDNVEVTWKQFGDPDPTNGTDTTLIGNVIGFYVPKATFMEFLQQPANATANLYEPVSFTAAAISDSQVIVGNTGNPNNWGTNTSFYQWQKNGQNIAGATTSQLTIVPALSDNGAQISCMARALGFVDAANNPAWTNSTVAILTVASPTPAPAIVSASYFTNNNDPVDYPNQQVVSIKFNNAMDPASLLNANYSISGMTVTGVTVYSNDYSGALAVPAAGFTYQNVLLPVTGTPTLPLTVTVANATDAWGRALAGAAGTASAGLCPLTTQDIGYLLEVDPAVPSLLWVDNTNAFTVECEGSDEWNTTDGCNFLYQTMTGDFDVVVRQENDGHTSNFAKGGLMVREELTAGSRNWDIANYPLSSDGIMAPDGSGYGLNIIECFCRWGAGLESVDCDLTPSGTGTWTNPPAYPNAWLRLIRTSVPAVGTNIILAWSADGQNWVTNSVTDPSTNGDATPLPDLVYVGMGTTAHNNDANVMWPVTDYSTLTYLNTVHYADYNPKYVWSPAKIPAKLSFTMSAGNIIISWAPTGGTLWSSPALGSAANWTAVGAANPATIPISGPANYFRVRNP
jgi:hypothetical protein